ncbi:MAG TPA: hypothetical protein VF843_12985 [Streptosporangiaceae bacterium]
MSGASQGAPSGWAAARRELIVAGLLVAAVTAAAWAFSGPVLAALVLVATAAASLPVLRGLIEPGHQPEPVEVPGETGPSRTVIGFWRTRSDLDDATRSLSAWHYGLRPRLTNLLAARLSERHGVSLAGDPEAARRLLEGSRHDLWRWIDPAQPDPDDPGSRAGIPPGVLAALIDRLEKL